MKFAALIIVLFSITVSAQKVGNYAELSQGQTYYRLRDKGAPQNIVILHGNAFSSWTNAGYVQPFVTAGMNVLQYDLYGMGKSARLKTTSYNRKQFLLQLEELLDHVGWSKSKRPIYMLGMGTGASLAATYTLKYPDRVARLVLVGPALDVHGTRSFTEKAFIEAMRQFPESETLRRMLLTQVEEAVEDYASKLTSGKGAFLKAKLNKIVYKTDYIDSLYRRLIGDSYNSYKKTYERLGAMNFPTLILVGQEDEESPEHHVTEIIDYYRLRNFVQVRRYPGYGSELSTLQSDTLMDRMLQYFEN